MARRRKSNKNIAMIGVILLISGICIAIWGSQMSESFGSAVTRVFAGTPPARVVYAYIGSVVCIIAGLYLIGRK